jgi:hypothetical protein
VGAIGGMLRSILVQVEGAVGLGMFCILSYLLFRARFIASVVVTTFDLCFYVGMYPTTKCCPVCVCPLLIVRVL